MIRDAQKNGLTIDDIAKMFSKTLNAVQQEDQKKKAITDARTELIEHMKDQFETAVSDGHLDCTDAAALYTLTMAEKYPDWTAENIKDYFQIIKLNAETTATKNLLATWKWSRLYAKWKWKNDWMEETK